MLHLLPISTNVLFFTLSISLHVAGSLSINAIPATYTLVSGRISACPTEVSYAKVLERKRFIPATSTSAGEFMCKGPGGKQVREGDLIMSHGLPLPSLVSRKDVSFIAGVETATRVCGPWAFNASSISWFLRNTNSKEIHDKDSGLTLEPGYIYLAYTHFTDFCFYQRREEELDIRYSGFPIPSQNFMKSSEEPNPTAEMVKESPPVNFDAFTCFPGSSTLRTEGGKVITMDDLQVGDKVVSNEAGQYSDIFMFSHQDRYIFSTFIVLQTSGKKEIMLSRGHYIFIDGVARAAKEAVVGQTVTTSSGTQEAISNVTFRRGRGLYNPQTINGTIVVNDILVTTWTTAVAPVTASALLSPVRFTYRLLPQRLSEVLSSYINVKLDMIRSI